MIQVEQDRPDTNPIDDQLAHDFHELRLSQARLLRDRTPVSCLIVEAIIVYFTALIIYAGEYGFAALWFGLTSGLVGVVYLYPKLVARNGINSQNLKLYLRGHIGISGVTGVLWSVFAIAFIDPNSTLHLFVSTTMVVSISLGGMMPSAEYRPSFIALSTGMFLPFSIYWLLAMEGPVRLIAIGLLALYGFGLLVSARAEIQTRETLAAKRNRELSEKLREQYRATRKVSAEKSRFLAATSHDMSQPLQAQGFFIRAIRPTLNTPEQTDLIDKIEASWRSQQTLLRALVETARLDSGAIIPKPLAFELASVLDGLRTEFAEAAKVKSINLIIASDAVGVESDPLLITRILRNLLSNAIKFTQAGGTVTLNWTSDSDRIVISVSDNGPGVTADQRDQIFEEYVQLESAHAGAQLGLGLGLTIVRQLATKLEIPLHFESERGKGTRIGISLPRARKAVKKTPVSQSISPFEGAPLIVLIEDEAGIRESVSILLTSWGCRVIAAASGPEAMELMSWADALPVAIIADKRLAKAEDGLDAALALREDALSDIPIVLLTGDIHQFEHVSGVPRISVLAKPAEAEELYRALRDALENT